VAPPGVTLEKAANSAFFYSNATPSTPERDTDLMPRLHPVYLPFRTQHQILTLVQSVLEECCFEFGNSWVPELMKAQKWEEAELVELTQWIQEFSKHGKSVPSEATRPAAGKSLEHVLFATSSLRHSAVHRRPTSAAGILEMLNAAITFSEALNDTKRATQIGEIKNELAIIIEDIVQHQNLLERKLCDQLKDLAKRRAEIDELERLAIENMLNNDKSHRTSRGSAVEDFLAELKQASQTCTSERTSIQQNQTADPRLGEDAEIVEEGTSPNYSGQSSR
jgi:hypothetical protein